MLNVEYFCTWNKISRQGRSQVRDEGSGNISKNITHLKHTNSKDDHSFVLLDDLQRIQSPPAASRQRARYLRFQQAHGSLRDHRPTRQATTIGDVRRKLQRNLRADASDLNILYLTFKYLSNFLWLIIITIEFILSYLCFIEDRSPILTTSIFHIILL